jgi:hypothetical protein
MMKQLLRAAIVTVLGVATIGFNWWYALARGQFSFFICMMGPVFLVFGLVTFFVPMDRLQQGSAEGPDMMSTRTKKLNSLGWTVGAIGLILGGVQYAMLKFGWFL